MSDQTKSNQKLENQIANNLGDLINLKSALEAILEDIPQENLETFSQVHSLSGEDLEDFNLEEHQMEQLVNFMEKINLEN